MTSHQVVVCVTCGTLAQALSAPRVEVEPYSAAWRRALPELWSAKGVFQILVFATACNFLITYGARLWPVGWALAAAWMLNLARRKALGFDAFALPLWEDLALVLGGALPRFAVVLTPVAIGALVWTDWGLTARPLTSPWPWLLAAAAVFAAAPAAVGASIEGAGLPWPWRRFAGDLRPARAAVLVAAASELVCSVLPPVNRALEDTRMLEHLAQAFVPRVITFVALAALGVFAGTLVHTHADHAPRVSARPTGTWVPPPPPPKKKVEPIALDDAPDDKAAALAALRAGHVPMRTLDADRALTLAQWLAGEGDFSAAAALLEVVTAQPGDDAAIAKAMVVHGRLCAERLGDPVKARQVFEAVARRFPGTTAAKFAVEQLAQHG